MFSPTALSDERLEKEKMNLFRCWSRSLLVGLTERRYLSSMWCLPKEFPREDVIMISEPSPCPRCDSIWLNVHISPRSLYRLTGENIINNINHSLLGKGLLRPKLIRIRIIQWNLVVISLGNSVWDSFPKRVRKFSIKVITNLWS